MNRRWPIVAAWSVLAATTIFAVLNAFTDVPQIIPAALAAATGFVWLCQRRYVQHALGGAATAGALLLAFFAPDGPVKDMWPAPLLLSGLLTGCRAVAERVVRSKPNPDGRRVMWLSSAIFGACMVPFLWSSGGSYWGFSNWRFIGLPLAGAAIAALAQIGAAVFLVKTIPEAKQDERPAIVLWLVLVTWMMAVPAR